MRGGRLQRSVILTKEIVMIAAAVLLLGGSRAQAMGKRLELRSDAIITEAHDSANISIYDTPPGHTTVDMLGGRISDIITYDASVLNVSGGSAEVLARISQVNRDN